MFRLYLKRAAITFIILLLFIIYNYNYNRSNTTVNQIKHNLHDFLPQTPQYYLVNSTKCKILNLNPFDKSVLHFFKTIKRTECYIYPPLTSVTYNPLTEKHTLRVNYSSVSYYTNSSHIRCCVKRLSQDILNVVFGPCLRFRDVFVMDKLHQFVFVFCLDDNRKIIYQNMHAAMVKIKRFSASKGKDRNKLNVLLIGFDSMSRMNFYRTMPKTATYLHTHGWTEMKGYNKIADNTLPNMMALLAGLPPETFRRAQQVDLDTMPFIWREFSSSGYVTAYAEDEPLLSTFHCHLNGFRRLPTDHYFHDYMHAGELLMMGNGGLPGCIANRSAADHMFDYLLDFVTVYKNESYFGLFWVNQISHNNLNRASGEDDNVLELLTRLVEAGTMNTTMVVVLSDHGLRVGDFRKTHHGWYEDRLPLLFISIPEWYKHINDLHYTNLLQNSERLTSPYDLYLTMKHVLSGKTSSVAPGCGSCQSLFTQVPPSRSCEEAGVSPHWCTCHPFSDLHFDPHNRSVALAIAKRVVAAVNDKVDKDPDIEADFECEKLKLRNILYIREISRPSGRELIVGIVTDPGGAELEGMVVVQEDHVYVEDSFSRLNSYGNESHCAENPISKLYCHCRPKQVNLGQLSESSA